MIYKFKKYKDRGIFFRFQKYFVESLLWAGLPKASKSIFPVIAVHCNKNGIAFPSQETIAILAGCTSRTVRSGLKGLEGFPGFNISFEVNSRGQRKNVYHFMIPNKKEKVFFFHKTIIDGGNWHYLSSSAKALYPVIKFFSFFDFENYKISMESDGIDMEDVERNDFFDSGYFRRKYDFLCADYDVLSEFSGISMPSLYSAFESLIEHELIKPACSFLPDRTYKVFLDPNRHYSRKELNDRIRAKYLKHI